MIPIKSFVTFLYGIALFGCSSFNLNNIQVTDSVNGRSCVYRGEDEGEITANDYEDDVAGLRRVAAKMKANTIVTKGTINKTSGFISFFECKDGLPTYWGDGVWFAKSLHEPKTRNEFNKAWSLCKYEAHKATVDTSHKPGTRSLYIGPTGFSTGDPLYDLSNSVGSFGNTMRQLEAIEQDKRNMADHEARLYEDRNTLLAECLEIQGFNSYRSMAKNAGNIFLDNCKKQDNQKVPCFIEQLK